MRTKKTLVICLAMLMILSFTLSACTQKAAPENPTPEAPKEKVINLTLDNEPPNIDPQVGTDLTSILIGGHVLEGLVRVYDGKVQPGIAEKWEISPDALTYTFHLRDAKWSDGVAITANDFYYSIMRLLDPKVAAGYAEVMGFYIKNAEKYYKGEITDKAQVGVKVIDDKTLEIQLENPTGYFIRLLGFMCFLPAREDLVTKYGEAYAADPDKMVYDGPYIVKEWKHEEGVTLAKNPNYWDKDKVKADIIELPIITDSKTSMNMFDTGSILSSAVPDDMLDTYKQKGTLQMMPNGGLFWLQFNYSSKTNGNILSNENFRKAISYALDRQSLMDNVVKRGEAASRYIPTNIMGLNDKFATENPLDGLNKTQDLAKAKEYFDKALKELNLTADKFPKLKLLGSDAPSTRIFVEAIQDMLNKSLGIQIELVIVPAKARLQAVNDRDYEMVYANWFPDYDDPMTYLDIWTTGNGFNRSDYSNPAFDTLIKEAKAATDEKVRQQKMFEAEKTLLDDMTVVPLYYGANAYVKSDKLVNYVRSMVGADPDLTYVDLK